MRILAVVLSLLSHSALADQQWPRIQGDPNTARCQEALVLATNTFNAKGLYLYGLQEPPSNFNSTLVLQASDFNIDKPTQDIFQKIYKNDIGFYWQQKAFYGLRFVISETPVGWRGNQYAIVAIKDDITSQQFVDKYDDSINTLSSANWNPPTILKDKNTNEIWAIDTGLPYNFLDDWNVYWVTENSKTSHCIIQFHKPATLVTDLLPEEVQKLAVILDKMLGTGENDGTLNQTASIQTNVMHTWANIALRPWILENAPKELARNTRSKVDLELRKLSKNSPGFRMLYQEMETQYPKAQKALSEYYQAQFDKTPTEADTLAAKAIDVGLRSYFIFPSKASNR